MDAVLLHFKWMEVVTRCSMDDPNYEINNSSWVWSSNFVVFPYLVLITSLFVLPYSGILPSYGAILGFSLVLKAFGT